MTFHTGLPYLGAVGTPNKTLHTVPDIMEITDFIHTEAGTHSAITDLVKSVLFNAYVSSLLAARSLHLCRDMICLSLIPSGSLSTITAAHSLCRQDLNCVSPALGQV